ncbi:MAG: M24 family metallopeptidase [Longimicrobiales bacterium]
MAETKTPDFGRMRRQLGEIQRAIAEAGLDGWLLYDLHARNAVAASMVGVGDLSRRTFVLIPAHGEPHALTHGIEEAPWAAWPWGRTSYVGWRELDEALRALLDGRARVAMEYSERDAVPAVDLVPAGVIELVRSAGAQVVSSGGLISSFYSSWSADDLASHRRASVALAQAAHTAFTRLARAIENGEPATEGDVTQWVVALLAEHGAGGAPDCIVATGVNAANPHYGPIDGGATFRKGDVVLLDLWSKEAADDVYADQTWMAYLGAEVPDRTAKLFSIIRDARDGAVAFLEDSWKAGRPVTGGEVDDVARGIITDQGYGAFFIHRTGHSIDQATHGMGPNIDNLETHEIRPLTPGVGFSIEPGIYIPGEIGVRTEINVYMSESGPEVTTPDPQREMLTLIGR